VYALKVSCGDRDCQGRPCSTAPPDEILEDFECGEKRYYPYEDNCIKYIECVDDAAYVKTCPVDRKIKLHVAIDSVHWFQPKRMSKRCGAPPAMAAWAGATSRRTCDATGGPFAMETTRTAGKRQPCLLQCATRSLVLPPASRTSNRDLARNAGANASMVSHQSRRGNGLNMHM